MKVHVAVLWPPKTTAPIAVTYDDDPDAPAVLVEPRCFRVGRSLGRTVYAQVGEEPSRDDLLVGVMETPYMAGIVVELLNERFGQRPGRPLQPGEVEWRCPTAGCATTAVTWGERAADPPRCFECPIPTGVVDGIQMVRS